MLSVRNFWRRHRRKVFFTAGVVGSGYLLYKLYDAHRRRLHALEREFALQRENDELIKAQLSEEAIYQFHDQELPVPKSRNSNDMLLFFSTGIDRMQAHFENIQRISDTITLPRAMHNLSCRIAEDLDLSQLLGRLIQEKGQPKTLTPSEKLDLWDGLKILSFTRMALSVWATTMLSLYIKVQVNILGRHLYIDTARKLGSSESMEGGDVFDREAHQKFLGSVNFLSQYGMHALISDMEAATKVVLKGKQLRGYFNSTDLRNAIMQILDTFMGMGSPHSWVKYVMPEDVKSHTTASGSDDIVPYHVTEFDQLMVEARAVLSSVEFGNLLDISLQVVVDTMVELMANSREGVTSGMPLAKVLPQVAQMCPLLLEEPSKNQFIQVIKNIPEVELFFTLLYANMSST